MSDHNLLREPLAHFFALGALLFAAYGWLNRDMPGDDEIVVDQARLSSIATSFEKTWQRPPSDEEMAGLVENWIREEILYREGLAAGLDRGDPLIRRRIAQKMSFVADGMVPDAPDEQALAAWLAAHRDRYRIPARFSLRQVFFDPQRHGDQLAEVLRTARKTLDSDDAGRPPPGDATLLPDNLADATAADIERSFGREFATAVEKLDVGSWHGPIRSGYGLHFILLEQRVPARDPELDEVRAAIERDLLDDRGRQINEEFYAALRARYTVRIDAAAQGT